MVFINLKSSIRCHFKTLTWFKNGFYLKWFLQNLNI